MQLVTEMPKESIKPEDFSEYVNKRSQEYWQKRFAQLEEAEARKGVEYFFEVQKQYEKAALNIEKEINQFYARYAGNENISFHEAQKILTKNELKEFKMSIEEYIEKGSSLDPKWRAELERASTKYRLSRLEALKVQMQQQIENVFGTQSDDLDDLLHDVYMSNYYRTGYETMKGIGIGYSFAKLDPRTVDKLIVKPWLPDGRNFSDRIWENKKELMNLLENDLTQAFIRGDNPQNLVNTLRKRCNVSAGRTQNLIATETAFFQSASKKDAFNALGVEEYQIDATLDSKTSETCRELDGKHLPMKEYKPGVTAPPFHARCRTSTIPYFDDEFTIDETRASRNSEGKYERVDASLTYRDWEERFVKPVIQNVANSAIIKLPSRSKEEIANYISKFNTTDVVSYPNGKNDEFLYRMMNKTGASGLPQKISEEEFEEIKKNGGVPLYHGFDDSKNIEKFLEGDVYVGVGVNGSGIYVSTSKKYSMRYAKGIEENVLKIVLDDKAKEITIHELLDKEKELIEYAEKIGTDKDKISSVIENKGRLAFLLGYDVINLGMHKIVVNRTAIKVVK